MRHIDLLFHSILEHAYDLKKKKKKKTFKKLRLVYPRFNSLTSPLTTYFVPQFIHL